MLERHLTINTQYSRVHHELRPLQPASRWVVDSKPLEPGKWCMAMAQRGCDTACGDAPVVDKKN
jgi:hypothetical protein